MTTPQRYEPGDTIPMVWTILNASGSGVAGLSPEIAVYEVGLGQYWTSGASFGASVTWHAMTDLNSAGLTGHYRYSFDDSVANPNRERRTYVTYFRSTTTLVAHANATYVVASLSKLLRNRWRIDAGTSKLYIYDDNGSTVLAEFDLKDAAGAASVAAIFEREPV